MKIVVCVKQVIDTGEALKLNSETNSFDEESSFYVANPCDVIAIEEALRVKERLKKGEVVVLTLGPYRAREVLIKGLAMGADRAIHLCIPAFGNADAYSTSIILARAISKLGYDLIFCGAQAADDNYGQVGAGIAELLDLPLVSIITKLEFTEDEKTVIVYRCLERGDQEVIQCHLPAVFTVAGGMCEHRYTSFHRLMAVRRRDIPVWDAKALGLTPSDADLSEPRLKVLSYSSPRPRAKKIFTPDSSLPAHERVKLLLSGGIVEKKTNLLEGSPQEVASDIAEFLVKEKIISVEGG